MLDQFLTLQNACLSGITYLRESKAWQIHDVVVVFANDLPHWKRKPHFIEYTQSREAGCHDGAIANTNR